MTSATSAGGPSFADRYAVLQLEDGGILLDLERGTYSALNVSAAMVCAALANGEPDVLVDDVARRLGIDNAAAAHAISEVRRGLDVPPPAHVDVGPFRYERSPTGEGYVLSHAREIRLEIDEDGARIRVPSTPVTAGQLYEYLRAVAPKVLFLRGSIVLHGSACWVGPHLRAICGASGAGKTTAGRAFVKAGLTPVSEDLLVLSSVSPATVFVDGERTVHGWARTAAQRVCDSRDMTIDTKGLQAALSGDTAPVGEVWFVEADRRHDDPVPSIRPLRLSRVEAAVKLMNAVFLGAAVPSSWRRFLKVVDELTSVLPFFEVAMPNGLPRLERAARDYTENSAS